MDEKIYLAKGIPHFSFFHVVKMPEDWKKTFDWKSPSREWDIRVNLGDNWEKELEMVIACCKKYVAEVETKYLLVGGAEKGMNREHSSYKKYHCHIALITKNRVYPVAVKNKLSLSKFLLDPKMTRQYYLSVRNIQFPYKGWRDHHTKCETKCYCGCFGEKVPHIAYEYGSLPADKRPAEEITAEDLSKRAKIEQRFQEMYEIFMKGDYDHVQMVRSYGKAWMSNYKDFVKMFGGRPCPDPPLGHFPDGKNLVIWGPPGTGKSLYVKLKYPNCFYRSAVNYKYWDGFKPEEHSHIYYEDMDRSMFNSRDIGPGQWKVWLDPEGIYDGEIKFQAPLAKIRHPVIVTSNYHPSEWLLPGYGSEKDKEAILRRLRVVHIDELLRADGIRLKRGMPPKSDPKDCFEPHDYNKQSVQYILN